MGYEHWALKAECGNCKHEVVWSCKSWKPPTPSYDWRCKKCGCKNYLKLPSKWSELPKTLYVGHERHKRLRLHPTPPELSDAIWAQPYSIRSFIYQASRKPGGCHYNCRLRNVEMGEGVFSDRCCPTEQANDAWPEDYSECHMACGWINGQGTCPLWSRIATLCQTDSERWFLHTYLGFVKHRPFPMILPQTWIDITDRRRPDFVAFVPLQYWHYERFAIQLDASHTKEQEADDAMRDAQISEQNYQVISLRPKNGGYLEALRRLVEHFDALMMQADDDIRSVAVEAVVARTETG